jgi:hypothetical protein
MICDSHQEADSILVDLRQRGTQVEAHELTGAPPGITPKSQADRDVEARWG